VPLQGSTHTSSLLLRLLLLLSSLLDKANTAQSPAAPLLSSS
jgi:hypothetical protein